VKRVLYILAFLALPSAASAQEQEDRRELGTRQRFTRIELGTRMSHVNDDGLDAFSKKDAFWQMALGMSRTMLVSGKFSFAPGFQWVYGSSVEQMRGLPAGLHDHRLTIPLEARWHMLPELFFFGRFAPGASYTRARVEDGSAAAPLVASRWQPIFDASAGVSWLAGPTDHPRSNTVRFWVTAEGGYAYSPGFAMSLSPDLKDDDPRRVGSLELRELALRGPFARLGVGLSF
jgi:hypothetical protein